MRQSVKVYFPIKKRNGMVMKEFSLNQYSTEGAIVKRNQKLTHEALDTELKEYISKNQRYSDDENFITLRNDF